MISPSSCVVATAQGVLYCHHVKLKVRRQVGHSFLFFGSSVSALLPPGRKKSQACVPKGHPSQVSLACCRCRWHITGIGGRTPQRLPCAGLAQASVGCSLGLRAAEPQSTLPDQGQAQATKAACATAPPAFGIASHLLQKARLALVHGPS